MLLKYNYVPCGISSIQLTQHKTLKKIYFCFLCRYCPFVYTIYLVEDDPFENETMSSPGESSQDYNHVAIVVDQHNHMLASHKPTECEPAIQLYGFAISRG